MSIYLLTYCWLNSLAVGDRLRCKVKPSLFSCRPTASRPISPEYTPPPSHRNTATQVLALVVSHHTIHPPGRTTIRSHTWPPPSQYLYCKPNIFVTHSKEAIRLIEFVWSPSGITLCPRIQIKYSWIHSFNISAGRFGIISEYRSSHGCECFVYDVVQLKMLH